ncbi:MAG: succinyl-diaminopimelate desuccinylase [Candidatus Phosphoribacter sp.]|nr:succinyl-diaminopimelate desuccinylase [Actinomycetales bacterium]
MPPTAPVLDLALDVASLTAAVCDIESVSGQEQDLADAVDVALRGLGHLEVIRDGHTVIARTNLGRAERVIIAGHLDTVPLTRHTPNLPTRRVGEDLVGRGTVDMKGGVAVMLRLALLLSSPNRDLTLCFYDCEEVEGERNGLKRIAENRPELLQADFAVLMEPTNGTVEGGCKGTLRVEVRTAGVASHSARPWMGHNAIHDAGEVLGRLIAYEPRVVDVDGLTYREALQAVLIEGGTAANIIPDACAVTVNYRYAPDRSEQEAVAHVREVFEGLVVDVTDNAGGARPGLDRPAARAFIDALGVPVQAKEGWTDVARFAALGVPAVNFGPGDPLLAHMDDERAPIEQYAAAEAAMLRWLGTPL